MESIVYIDNGLINRGVLHLLRINLRIIGMELIVIARGSNYLIVKKYTDPDIKDYSHYCIGKILENCFDGIKK